MSAVPLEDEDPVVFGDGRGDGRGYGTRAGNGMGNGDVAAERECDIDPDNWLLFGGEVGGASPTWRRRVDFDQPLATPVAFMAIDDETGGD